MILQKGINMHIDIIFGILLTLNRKKQVTAKYLSQKYDVSVRTIYRYISILDSNNIPITTKKGKNGGIILNNCVQLNNLFFTAYSFLKLSFLRFWHVGFLLFLPH